MRFNQVTWLRCTLPRPGVLSRLFSITVCTGQNKLDARPLLVRVYIRLNGNVIFCDTSNRLREKW